MIWLPHLPLATLSLAPPHPAALHTLSVAMVVAINLGELCWDGVSEKTLLGSGATQPSGLWRELAQQEKKVCVRRGD